MYRQSEKGDRRVVMAAKKPGGASFRDGGDGDGDENALFCNRFGCRGRIKYPQNIKFGSSFTTRKSSTGDSVTENYGRLPPNSKRNSHPLPQSQYGHMKSRSSSNSKLPFSRSTNGSNPESQVEKRIPVASSNRSFGNQNASVVTSAPSLSRCSALRPSNGTGEGRCAKRNPKLYAVPDSPQKTNAEPSVDTPSSSMTKASTPSRFGGSGVSVFRSQTPRNASTRMGFSSWQNDRNNSSAGKSPVPDNGSGRLFRINDSRSYSHNNVVPRATDEFTPPTSRDFLHHYNINRAAEILLALERIECDEDRTPEQILLDMSLFLSGLTLYDQHRDLRLDIDEMSYEDLLALGESMGTVSTPLSEEELSKCLKRSIHQETTRSGGDLDDTKCSICQEEYVMGDAIGILSECRHRYHETCVIQWLQLKSWCPVCKADAAAR